MKILTRRRSLQMAAALAALFPAGVFAKKLEQSLADERTRNIFLTGVASGDPTQDSVVLWTRINLESRSRKNSAKNSQQVSWQLSTSPGFEKILKKGRINTDASRDFTVKVEVRGLKAGQQYYYRFLTEGIYSEIGRTRTLPADDVKQLGIAVVSCSNFPFGFFNAYDAIAEDDAIDFVLHLGDYLYEYGHDGYGAEVGRQLKREHVPAHEILSLNDYRLRHAQYKADIASRKMHAAHPLIAIWDDHESANNPYMQGAQNHQPDEGLWHERRRVSLQAYYEWMPIRDPKRAEKLEELWRYFEFGKLASLTTLETRHTGRSKQIDYAEHLPSVTNIEQREHFVNSVLGDKARTMTSKKMDAFLSQSLDSAVKKNIHWNFIGNQIPMARTHVPTLPEAMYQQLMQGAPEAIQREISQFKMLGELDLPIYTDTWDGYPAAREHFYKRCRASGIDNLFVLTGDSHAFWHNRLSDSNDEFIGYEIGTTAVTSPGDFQALGAELAAKLDEMIVQKNPEILWTDNLSKGYVRLRITANQLNCDYIAVSTVSSPTYQVSVVKSLDYSLL